jgi:4-hydroxybenzoate polyprenyltransferase
VLNISLANPLEVILAICFVLVAFAVLIGTFVIAIAYVYSNVFERWPDYSSTKRIQVVRNIAIALATIAALIWFASNRF